MDLDERALSNAGVWLIGRLQTDADRERAIEGLGGSSEDDGPSKSELAAIVKKLNHYGVPDCIVKDVRIDGMAARNPDERRTPMPTCRALPEGCDVGEGRT